MPIPQFSIRKLKGMTEIKLIDDRSFRNELAHAFPDYAPLLAERAGAPTFDELKATPEVAHFLESSELAGKTYDVNLVIRGQGAVIREKQVLFVDKAKHVCAISSWSAEGGMIFRTTN